MFLNRKLSGVYLVFRTTLGEYSFSCTEFTFTTPARSAPPPLFLLDVALMTRMMFFCYFSNNRDYPPFFKKRLPRKTFVRSFFLSFQQTEQRTTRSKMFHEIFVSSFPCTFPPLWKTRKSSSSRSSRDACTDDPVHTAQTVSAPSP